MAQTLTVAERILYHLSAHMKAEEKFEVPFDITQDGIAQACGISRAHAAIELKKLRETGHIVERLSHVRRAKSRRKVYFLTMEGKEKSAKIVDHVRTMSIDSGVDSSRISVGTGPAKRARRYSTALPQLKAFIGRKEELSRLQSLAQDDSVEIILLTGLGGIGKSTLLTRFAKESRSSIFWFSLSEWETEISLLKALAGFLEENGDNRLSNYLRSDSIDLGEISYMLGEALSENRRVLMIDDVDKAPRLESLVRMILDNAGPNKVIITAESPPAMIEGYRARGKSVRHIVLNGLEREDALELLGSRGIVGEPATRLFRLTDGHPLLLGMLPSDDEGLAKQEMSNFVRNGLLKGLSERQLRTVEKCSVFRKPFPPTFLGKEERDALRLPIFFQISGSYIMHQLVRDIVTEQISEEELRALHSWAADIYLSQANWSERLFHLVMAGRFTEAEMLVSRHSEDLISTESPQNLMEEISLIPGRISKYSHAIEMLSARAATMLGDEKGAKERLNGMLSSESKEERASALIELSGQRLDAGEKRSISGQLSVMLEDEDIGAGIRSRIALSLASMSFFEGEFEECERFASGGIVLAGNVFDIETISALNRLLGQTLVIRERFSEATQFLPQVAPSFEGAHRATYHRLMARSMLEIGRSAEASANLEAGIGLAESNGQYKELADLLIELCHAKMACGDYEAAAEACFRCIDLSSSLNDFGTLAIAHACLSSVERERGNLKEADESAATAERLSHEHALDLPLTPVGRALSD